MLFKPRRKPGVADVSDLTRNPVVEFQRKWHIELILLVGFVLPTIIPGILWGDYWGGYFYAGHLRLVFVHHVRFRTHNDLVRPFLTFVYSSLLSV